MTDNSTITSAFSSPSAISRSWRSVTEAESAPSSSSSSLFPSCSSHRWSSSAALSLTKIPIPSYTHDAQSNPVAAAEEFYATKLRSNPQMARYNTFVAAIASAQGERERADAHYRQAIVSAPGDVLNRSDFALHLAREGSKEKRQDAVKEMHRTLLLTDTNAHLHKNMGALYAKVGDYRAALRHSDNARVLNGSDSMTHRNLAKLHAVLGDTHKALEHNLQSIELEDAQGVAVPHTSAYRASAVQIIAKGGDREEALALMKAACAHERKSFPLSTTQRTNEILEKVQRQQQQVLLEKALERQKEEERKAKVREEWKQILQNVKG